MEKPIIELKEITKKYDDKIILDNVNLVINKGEFVTLLGPSGSGKTTILKLIGGFEWATRGEILFNGIDIKDLPAHKRETSTIFQDYALFPHLNVENNIKYGLKLKRILKPKDHISENTIKKLKLLEKKWIKKANEKKKQLDKIQAQYEKDLTKKRIPKKKKQKIQSWLDDSDFKYSRWETYPMMMKEKFEKIHLTRKITKEEINKIVYEALYLVGLEGHEKKQIDQLSGGQKQRVALARSIVVEPSVLLLDEPLSALDPKTREKMQNFLLEIQKKLKITFIFVSHDREEALRLSDKIAILRDGKIEQFGKPKEIYDYPKNYYVAQFIGDFNIFKGRILDDEKILFCNKKIKYSSKKYTDFKNDEIVDVLIRPEDINIKRNEGIILGKIIEIIYKGSYYLINVKTKFGIFHIEATTEHQKGEKVFLDWAISSMHLMPIDEKYTSTNSLEINLNNGDDYFDENEEINIEEKIK